MATHVPPSHHWARLHHLIWLCNVSMVRNPRKLAALWAAANYGRCDWRAIARLDSMLRRHRRRVQVHREHDLELAHQVTRVDEVGRFDDRDAVKERDVAELAVEVGQVQVARGDAPEVRLELAVHRLVLELRDGGDRVELA